MAFYTWRNTGSAFDDPASWSNPTEAVSATVPTATDTASLVGGGGNLSGIGSVDLLAFSSATWSIFGQLTANRATVENAALVVAVNGGQLVINGTLQAGLLGSGSVVVADGGTLVATGNAFVPPSSFGSASLTVARRGLASFAGLLLGVNGTSSSAVVDAAAMTVGGIFQLGAGGAGAGAGGLAIRNGGQVVLSAATDTTTPYLKVGAVDGSSGAVAVDGPTSLLLLANNSGAVGFRGTGTLTVTGGASARFNASASSNNNALNPALTIGRFGQGTVVVAGAGSLIAAGGSVIVGVAGQGSLTVQDGAAVTAVGFVATQAALAVGTTAGGSGAVLITGPGSSLAAGGAVIVGGDNRGSGLSGIGAGSITVNNGGLLQTGDMTILPGSLIKVDGASQVGVGGNLSLAGSVTSAGTFVVSGAVYGGGSLTIGGGVADIGSLGAAGFASAPVTFASATATIRLRGVVGANSIAAMQIGDEIDFVGNSSVRLFQNVLTTTTGTVALSAAPAGSHYQARNDGAGGTSVTLTLDTIGVYRFFDSNYGTHFFSGSAVEKDTVISTRADLIYEGVGLQSVNPANNDPAASDVFRFFDNNYGTHFFTASPSERDTVRATRSDLIYEGTGFIEHAAQQPGDTGVYRFFDTRYGTHFYTADANEHATVVATRPDLIDEGIGFWAPTN